MEPVIKVGVVPRSTLQNIYSKYKGHGSHGQVLLAIGTMMHQAPTQYLDVDMSMLAEKFKGPLQ